MSDLPAPLSFPRKMSFWDYRALPGMNWSLLKAMGDSAKHFRHAEQYERGDTDTLLVGRATHTATLEPYEFEKTYAIWTGDRRAGKKWDEFKVTAADAGLECLREKDRREVLAMAWAVRMHPAARDILSKGRAERVYQWHDRETGILCKARLDWTRASLVSDLKTTQSVEPEAFARSVVNYCYEGQAAFYSDGFEAVTGRKPAFAHIAVESSAPYDVGVFEMPPDALELGRHRYRGYLKLLAACRAFDNYPGRSSKIQTLRLPGWAYTRNL